MRSWVVGAEEACVALGDKEVGALSFSEVLVVRNNTPSRAECEFGIDTTFVNGYH